MTTKKCARCKEFKPLDDFSAAKNIQKSHLMKKYAYCKPCYSIVNKENLTKLRAKQIQESNNISKYLANRIPPCS